ncbi:MAG: DUF5615 family PIN-like protein [Promethearchaeota archaeon]
MKFLADEMCGNIVRWLRILGFDATYSKDYENKYESPVKDANLIEEAINDKRILISKDKEMVKIFETKIKMELQRNPNFLKEFYHPHKINETQTIIPVYFANEKQTLDNLTQLFKKFNFISDLNIEYNPDTARCTKCNSRLEKIVAKEKYKDLIPEQAYKYHDEFLICKNAECRQIYWKGSHFSRIEKFIEKLKQNLN